ncbi:MAG: 30S ribosomal protein S20 [Caldilineaceae bacterium]|nr:30S ribosomal protein S20 [Caldilineaceae bacterium]HRW04725.1 30S ribosomal protein S20 [Caldilineaceae bacterium]
MANIKSAEKRNRQAAKRTARNRVVRGTSRTAVKRARTALNNESAESRAEVLNAMRALDRAASKGVLHKNNAARRKSRLMKALNKLEAAGE